MRGEEDAFVRTVRQDEPKDVLSCQPCGCDPGNLSNTGNPWTCAAYPNCAWGKAEERRTFAADAPYTTVLGKKDSERLAQKLVQPSPYSDKSKHVGIGGAPSRATTLPHEPQLRKVYPVASGVLDYFPDALVAISNVSWKGNEQHNPGQPLHWARGKSADESDTMIRHFLQRGTMDDDGIRHSAKMAWRALALLQKEIESERV
jgi:hypothetical protein